MNRIRLFFLLDNHSKLLFLEAFSCLGWARFIKGRSFSKLAPNLGETMVETPFNSQQSSEKLIKKISQAIQIMSRYTLWESKCLVKAIAAMKMLEKRKIESTLYLGTAKDENGKLIAHAWLRSGPYYLTGWEEMERFIVVGKFGKRIFIKNIVR